MNLTSQKLVRVIVERTGYSQDEVQRVLDVLRDVIIDRLSYNEGVVVNGMFRVRAVFKKRCGWRAEVNLFKVLTNAVGTSMKPI